MSEAVLQRAGRNATRAAGIVKPASVHTLRHSFAMLRILRAALERRTDRWFPAFARMTSLAWIPALDPVKGRLFARMTE